MYVMAMINYENSTSKERVAERREKDHGPRCFQYTPPHITRAIIDNRPSVEKCDSLFQAKFNFDTQDKE
jgi:hypothetical protein